MEAAKENILPAIREKIEAWIEEAPEADDQASTTTWTRTCSVTDMTAAVDSYFSANVPAEYRKADPDNVPQISEMLSQGGVCGVFIGGTPGIGKTYAATAIARWLIMQKPEKFHFDGYIKAWRVNDDRFAWIESPYLLARIRGSFNTDKPPTELDIIDECIEPEILLLDDLGAEKQSQFTGATLYTIISKRRNDRKFTIITSNQRISQIEEWEPRIASRISEMYQLRLPNVNRRKKQNGKAERPTESKIIARDRHIQD